MTFIDLGFLVFLLVSIIAFYICPVKYRWIALLVISIVFYAINGLSFLPFIFVTSLTIFLAGRKMGSIYAKNEEALSNKELSRQEKKALKETAKKKCKSVFLAPLIINLAILAIVKYTKFFINPINDLIGMMGGENGSFTAASIIVPLGISYYTFSSISYLLDVFWKRVEYEKNYFRFLLYLIYFPHILQGPIERYGRLGQRLKQELVFDWDRIVAGLQLMIWGFFKKLVIADRIDTFITTAYNEYDKAGSLALAMAILLDVVYIYADFSGCMDIARGVSQIFGVELDLNFNHPFSSQSIVEFWRRWHMSLGSWFKDYVYYPISTSRLVKNLTKSTRGKVSPKFHRAIVTVVPVFCTWVLTGVWHGTGITYVSWGIYYSIMIFLSVTTEEDFKNLNAKLKLKTDTYAFHCFRACRTTLIFAGGRLLTRPNSLEKTVQIIKHLFTDFNLISTSIVNYGIDKNDKIIAFIAILLFGIVSHLEIKHGDLRDIINKKSIIIRWPIFIALIMAIVIFGIYGPGYDASSFVYMAY